MNRSRRMDRVKKSLHCVGGGIVGILTVAVWITGVPEVYKLWGFLGMQCLGVAALSFIVGVGLPLSWRIGPRLLVGGFVGVSWAVVVVLIVVSRI